jgi:hypothetical protein
MSNQPHSRWHSHLRGRATLAPAALMVALVGACPFDGAMAQSSFLAYAAACQSDCVYGPTVFWTPPAGTAVSSSVSHGWSYVATGTDTSYNYGASAAAQATISGVNQWSASSSAGGYFNSPGSFVSNGVAGTAVILVRDEFRLPSSPNWSGPGWLRLSYRITGDVALNYAETSNVSGQALGSAQSSITFECGSARVGGAGSSLCESPDFPPPSPGSTNLIGHLDYNASQTVDKIVNFSMPVYSDLFYVYRLQTSVNSRLTMNPTNRTGLINGITSADFSHTFALVDAQLFDAGMNPVPQWSVQAGSGFDYAHIAAVPEPTTGALLVAGAGLIGWRLRRRPTRPAPTSGLPRRI